jgi:hypothetical protein
LEECYEELSKVQVSTGGKASEFVKRYIDAFITQKQTSVYHSSNQYIEITITKLNPKVLELVEERAKNFKDTSIKL